MARNKKSPALFEVIRNAQQKQKELAERQRQQQLAAELRAQSPAAALLSSPIYWFKGKVAHEAAIERPDAAIDAPLPVMRELPKTRSEITRMPPPPTPVFSQDRETAVDRAPVIRSEPPVEAPRVEASPDVIPAVIPAVIEMPSEPAAPPVPAHRPAPMSAAAEAARQVRQEIAAQEAPAAEPVFGLPSYDKAYSPTDFDDADEPAAVGRGFQLSYTGVAVAGFAIMVAFAVAYVIGSHNRNEKLAVAAENRATKPHVLDVRNNVEPPVKPAPPVADDDIRGRMNNAADLGLNGIGKPIAVPTGVQRVVGLQYVVLQSFPSEYDAKELVKFLAQNGVPATAERPLPGYAPRWTSVITTRGFDRTKSNPAFDAYGDALKGVLTKYASEQGGLKKHFKLDIYTWRTAK